MTSATERFLTAADELGIAVEPVGYPQGTRTAQDAADAIGCEVDQIVKSLVFVAVDHDGDDQAVLALTAGGNRVDTDALARVHGADRIRKANADEVRAATGFAIGGTPPFGHPTPIPTYLDPRLVDFDHVWAAAGTPRDVFRCTADELRTAGARDAGDFTE